jgi:tetratricopeptide (TPR) repeat protein
VHSRGGLISTLRELGRFDEAVVEAFELVEKVPASSDSMWTLADAQIDARDFDGAVKTLNSAIENHRHSAGLRTGLARLEKAKGHYAAALGLYDDAARDFPSNASIQIGRADMLRRLGGVDEALRIYERSLINQPHRLSLKNALASVYIHKRRFSEALALLTIDDPHSADEWRNFALRGMLDSATGSLKDAGERFAWGIERCPFRRERHMLRAALTRLQLKEGASGEAVETAEECTGDVTEIVKFHAIAAMEDKGPARALYDRLLQSYLPEPYHELRDEIARHYKVVALPTRRNLDWVLERESDALLLEAA